MNDIIQSLWIGGELSSIEKICINSFLKNGHPFHLYTYSNIEGVPKGTTILDANTIIPKSKIFRYPNGSVACFANYFRYKLLFEKGNWWVDTDVICLAPFHFKEKYVFGIQDVNPLMINNAIMKFPKNDTLMKTLMLSSSLPNKIYRSDSIKRIIRKVFNYTYHRNKIAAYAWGETGPSLLTQHIQSSKLDIFSQKKDVFYPVHWNDWKILFEENVNMDSIQKNETVAIHLWNEMFRKNIDKNGKFRKGSILEYLENKYM